MKNDVTTTLEKIPTVGKGMVNSIHKIKDGIKQILVPGMLLKIWVLNILDLLMDII